MANIKVTNSEEVISFSFDAIVENTPIELTQQITNISSDDAMYATRVDFVDIENKIYRGEAAVGSAEGDSVWRIREIVINPASDDDISTKFADGNENFDNIWTNRASLFYS